MLALLTNYTLDVSFGILWWVTKNTTLAVYNGVCYLSRSKYNDNNDIKNDYILINSDSELTSLKKEIQELKLMIKNN